MHRLFVAIRPPRAIREQLLERMHGIAAARWQDDGQLHLTLRFIGGVARPLAEDIATALGHVAAPAFEIALDGVGSFEKNGRPGTIWAGIAPSEPLKRLRDKVERALQPLGVKPDHRAFLPHITIARPNSGSGPVADFMARNAGLTSARFPVAHFELFESVLGTGGARYDSIARYPLR